MKIGDKVICKKDYLLFNNSGYAFKKSESYLIVHVATNFINVESDYLMSSFSFNDNHTNTHHYNNQFFDIFMTPQEYRKMKLEKINETNI